MRFEFKKFEPKSELLIIYNTNIIYLKSCGNKVSHMLFIYLPNAVSHLVVENETFIVFHLPTEQSNMPTPGSNRWCQLTAPSTTLCTKGNFSVIS